MKEGGRFAAILRRTLGKGWEPHPRLGTSDNSGTRAMGKTMGIMAGGPFVEKLKLI